MTKFDEFLGTVAGRFPSETSAYFAKPLLREAFAAGQASVPKRKGEPAPDAAEQVREFGAAILRRAEHA